MLQVKNISFSYVPDKQVIKEVSFDLQEGQHLCVMGESGCGKSTLLKVIYGLYDLDSGSLSWKDHQILGPAYHLIPGMFFSKYVAQEFDLMPFTTVSENISKFLSRFYPEESRKRTEELLEVIEMTDFADAKVKTLSGGQKQRVAIARALAREPELLLLDEPFSQIDNFKKRSLRRMLFSYLKEKKITCIVATHDAEDALSFADRMIVMQNNSVMANGAPRDIFTGPGSKYTASLFDDVNELQVNGKKVFLYPHQLKIVSHSEFKATVRNSYFKGTHWLIELGFDDRTIFVNHHKDLRASTTVCLEIQG